MLLLHSSLDSAEMPEIYLEGLFIFQTGVSSKQRTFFLPLESQLIFFNLCWIFLLSSVMIFCALES